jgi:4-hydroxy-tetrahydrodipicolinate reductase
MGHLIEQLAQARGFDVRLRLDASSNAKASGITADNFRGIDVAVDFSISSAVVENIERLAALGVNTVVGTTGWTEQLDHVRSVVEKAGIGLVWSPNYSIGIAAFLRLVSEASRLLADQPEYDAWAWEIHHAAKKDAPSGTLLKLVAEMKKSAPARPVNISSSRAGAHPGTHEIGFDSPCDTITLRHTARNPEGFVQGALIAAHWIIGRKGFYEFRDVLFQ